MCCCTHVFQFGRSRFGFWNICKSERVQCPAFKRKVWHARRESYYWENMSAECFGPCSGPWHKPCKVSGHRLNAGATDHAGSFSCRLRACCSKALGSFPLCLANPVAYDTKARWVVWVPTSLGDAKEEKNKKKRNLHVSFVFLMQVHALLCGHWNKVHEPAETSKLAAEGRIYFISQLVTITVTAL